MNKLLPGLLFLLLSFSASAQLPGAIHDSADVQLAGSGHQPENGK